MNIDRLCQILLEQLRLEIITTEQAMNKIKKYYTEVNYQKHLLKNLKGIKN